MQQLSFLGEDARVQRPWKRTTTTSKAAVKAIELSGAAARIRMLCLTGLRAMWNRSQEWPTADELADYLFHRQLIPSAHRDEVSPRLNELADGRWLVSLVAGQRVRRQVGGGEVQRGVKRPSRVSGRLVLTWRVKEAGA